MASYLVLWDGATCNYPDPYIMADATNDSSCLTFASCTYEIEVSWLGWTWTAGGADTPSFNIFLPAPPLTTLLVNYFTSFDDGEHDAGLTATLTITRVSDGETKTAHIPLVYRWAYPLLNPCGSSDFIFPPFVYEDLSIQLVKGRSFRQIRYFPPGIAYRSVPSAGGVGYMNEYYPDLGMEVVMANFPTLSIDRADGLIGAHHYHSRAFSIFFDPGTTFDGGAEDVIVIEPLQHPRMQFGVETLYCLSTFFPGLNPIGGAGGTSAAQRDADWLYGAVVVNSRQGAATSLAPACETWNEGWHHYRISGDLNGEYKWWLGVGGIFNNLLTVSYLDYLKRTGTLQVSYVSLNGTCTDYSPDCYLKLYGGIPMVSETTLFIRIDFADFNAPADWENSTAQVFNMSAGGHSYGMTKDDVFTSSTKVYSFSVAAGSYTLTFLNDDFFSHITITQEEVSEAKRYQQGIILLGAGLVEAKADKGLVRSPHLVPVRAMNEGELTMTNYAYDNLGWVGLLEDAGQVQRVSPDLVLVYFDRMGNRWTLPLFLDSVSSSVAAGRTLAGKIEYVAENMAGMAVDWHYNDSASVGHYVTPTLQADLLRQVVTEISASPVYVALRNNTAYLAQVTNISGEWSRRQKEGQVRVDVRLNGSANFEKIM